MSRLPFEAFLAFRYLRPRRTFVSVITVISILGVLLGVAVLIIVISVMSGFDREWRDRILGFKSHIKVFRPEGAPMADYEKVMTAISTNPEVVGVAPFIAGQVLLKTQPTIGQPKTVVPNLLGVDQEAQAKVSILPTNMVSGKFDLSRHGMVVGTEFADSMRLQVGDRVAVYSSSSIEKLMKSRNPTNNNASLPIAEEYVVRGIFDVGFGEFNSTIVVVSLDSAQELCAMPEGTVQALQVKLRDPFQANRVASELSQKLEEPLDIVTWKQENAHIFDALAVEKDMMFYLLFFIMIVAGFGIVNCQITFVVQKTREIGILKSLGANNRQVLWLFLSQSVVVGVLGVGLGLALAILALSYRNEFLLLMRRVTGANLLDSSVYGVYNLPASIQPGDITFICVTAFVTCVLAGLFPAWKASRLQPVEALRYE